MRGTLCRVGSIIGVQQQPASLSQSLSRALMLLSWVDGDQYECKFTLPHVSLPMMKPEEWGGFNQPAV